MTKQTLNYYKDHPRIRGEHASSVCAFRAFVGSSPHTRGAHAVGRQWRPASGIIPAYAGSTSICAQPRTPRKDHPRIRGEHGCQAILVDSDFGSSPHTRGALPLDFDALAETRIIPAYAGSTRS